MKKIWGLPVEKLEITGSKSMGIRRVQVVGIAG
jgi:hypothetical protein